MTRKEALNLAWETANGLRRAAGLHPPTQQKYLAFRTREGKEWTVVFRGGVEEATLLDPPQVDWRPVTQ
ncbi:MAG: hypothetical protein ACK47B_17135 [Armatimonadota bacterium]